MTKRTMGGWFVILNFIFCIFYCFEGTLFNVEITVGGIIGIWVFLLCSITIFLFIGSAIKSSDFTMIAGYDPKKKYNKEEFSNYLRHIVLFNSFISMIYSALYLITPLFEELYRSLYNGVLTAAYIVNLALLILHTNRKFKGKLIMED